MLSSTTEVLAQVLVKHLGARDCNLAGVGEVALWGEANVGVCLICHKSLVVGIQSFEWLNSLLFELRNVLPFVDVPFDHMRETRSVVEIAVQHLGPEWWRGPSCLQALHVAWQEDVRLVI